MFLSSWTKKPSLLAVLSINPALFWSFLNHLYRSAIGQVRTLLESDYRDDSIHVVLLFELTAGVYNLFDKTVDYSSYGTVLDGRRYNLGVTYNF